MKIETLRHLRNGGSVRFEDGEEILFCSIGKAPTVEDLIAQGFLSPTGRIRKYTAGPDIQNFPNRVTPLKPSDAPKWPCPGEQAVPDHIYGPAALHMAQVEAQEAKRQEHEAKKLALRMTKHACFYQVLALLGWAAVIVTEVLG